MHVRCPHCQTPQELAGESDFSDITCPQCGSHFNLLGESTIDYHRSAIERFGRFELLEVLGVGAFGCVWKARDTELDRVVAVKVPRQERLDPAAAENFLREARAAAQLRHPHIVSVHEVGRHEGQVFIVSDFVEGTTLSSRLTARRFSAPEAAALCAKLADALAHAHQAGVIHRDLKPGNIMLDPAGEPHIMDFGLARRQAGEVSMTVDGKVLGTPAYMSPEQARGMAHHADHRTDIYSLGTILFELLTGERPFRGDARMLVHQVIHDDPPSPRRLNATVGRDLETICLKCLEKDAKKRYESAQALADELRRQLRGEPILARRISRAARAARWCQRNPVAAALAAVLLLLAVVGPLAAVTQASLRRAADDAAARAERLGLQEAAARKRTAHSLYVAHMNMAQHASEAEHVGPVPEILSRYLPREGEEDLRGFEWYYWWRQCHLYRMSLDYRAGYAWCTAFSPDGSLVAVAGSHVALPAYETPSADAGDFSIKLFSARSGEIQAELAGHAGGVLSLAFSPDGITLASSGFDRTVKLWNVAAGGDPKVLAHDQVVHAMAFFDRGRALAAGGRGGRLVFWDLEAEEPAATHQENEASVTCLAVSPQGDRLATGHSNGAIQVWDAAAREKLGDPMQNDTHVSSLAFSPDGQTLVSGDFDYAVKRWRVRDGQVEPPNLAAHANIVNAVAFLLDGRLATGSSDGKVILWDCADARPVAVLKGYGDQVLSLAVSPDGQTLAVGGGNATVKLWDISAADDPDVLAHPEFDTFGVRAIALAPDGTRAAAAGTGLVRLWDMTKAPPARLGEIDDVVARSVAFSSDGEILACGFADGTIGLYRAETVEPLSELDGGRGAVFAVAFSPRGSQLAAATSRQKVHVWDLAANTLSHTLEGYAFHVMAPLAYSPDGAILATGRPGGEVALWNASTGELDATLAAPLQRVFSVAFSKRGGRLAASGEDGSIAVWDLATRERMRLQGATTWVRSIDFSPDGTRLASASDDRTVTLWDLETGEPTTRLRGHTNYVMCLAFSPDGRLLASGSQDKSLRLWRVASDDFVANEQ